MQKNPSIEIRLRTWLNTPDDRRFQVWLQSQLFAFKTNCLPNAIAPACGKTGPRRCWARGDRLIYHQHTPSSVGASVCISLWSLFYKILASLHRHLLLLFPSPGNPLPIILEKIHWCLNVYKNLEIKRGQRITEFWPKPVMVPFWMIVFP